MAIVVAIGAARRQGSNSSEDSSNYAIVPYERAGEEHSRLPDWYTDRVESSPRQVFLLIALLFCLLTAFAKKQQNREEQLMCQILGAVALVMLAAVDMTDPFSAAIIVMIVGFLAAVVIVACLENSSKMHIIILSLLVLPPTLIATLANKLELTIRIALLLSPVTWIVYKSTVRAIRGAVLEDMDPVKRELTASTAIVLFSAVTAVLNPCSSPVWAGGFIFAIGGCIAFNACLIVLRSKNRNPVAEAKDYELTIVYLGLMIASMVVCNILIYASLYYKFPSIVIIPTIALIWSYFVFVYLHDHIRGVTHNALYFIFIGSTFLITISQVSFLPLPNVENVDQTDHERLESAAKQTRSGFVALTSGMLFVYFMMTLLVQTDEDPDSGDSDSREEAQELTPASTAARTVRRPAAAAAAKHSTVPVAVVINRPSVERSRRAPVVPVAVAIDRPCSERTCEAGTCNSVSRTAIMTPRPHCSASSSSSLRESSREEEFPWPHETLLQPD